MAKNSLTIYQGTGLSNWWEFHKKVGPRVKRNYRDKAGIKITDSPYLTLQHF